MASTTIRVRLHTRDHLAELADERGMSIGELVDALATAHPTAVQRAGLLAADREVVRRLIGIDISDEDFDRAPDVLGNIRKLAAEKVLAARQPSDQASPRL
ncbi:hypothetical protein ABZ769_04855 [Streptomyces olivoreticuli]